MRVIVVGARTVRQGTGPFIAAALTAQGVEVCAVVGTSTETVASACQRLKDDWQINCKGYTDLEDALGREKPDAVALCSPWRFHAQQLPTIAMHGCHCLVEKPLAWPATESRVDNLISAFEQRGLVLEVVAQWPWTLPAFQQLHGQHRKPTKSFSMRLSPISIGPDMVTDAAPHFVSMLQALAGSGDLENIQVIKHGAAARGMDIVCSYRHGAGVTSAALHLKVCEERPRPAWYSIDGKRADREVILPAYRQFLIAGRRRVELPDPIHQVVRSFIEKVDRGDTTGGEVLRRAHRNLQQLAATQEIPA